MPFASYGLLQNIKRSQKRKRKSGACSGKHTFAADGDIHLGQQMVSPHIYFFHKHIYNHMLLIATYRKLRLILHLYPLTCITGGIRD
jgi:hypothetical protein